LPGQRSAADYRLYDDAAVDRLGFIGAGKHLGLPLEEIADDRTLEVDGEPLVATAYLVATGAAASGP
jgi:DNA-binding transcriptional MerR regulator